MPKPMSGATQFSVGSVRRMPGTPVATADGVMRALGDGLASATAGLTSNSLRGARLELPALVIRLRAGADARAIEEVVCRAMERAIREHQR
jgi:hypothetical protein